jgi:hypothetical protein
LLKHVFNPYALWTTALGATSWGIVHHVGRRLGAAYQIPLAAARTANGVVIALPYEPRAYWCRNILAAGSCTLTLEGNELTLTSPKVVPVSVAEPQMLAVNASLWHRTGIERYLSLRLAPGTLETTPTSVAAHKQHATRVIISTKSADITVCWTCDPLGDSSPAG